MGAAPTPPSLMDPSLNFDWDQWDAVFGQHLPLPDELMESDPVSGFEYGDYTQVSPPQSGRNVSGSSPAGMNPSETMPPDWEGYC